MKAAINQLKKYVQIDDISSIDLIQGLNLAGIEVEGVLSKAVASNCIIGQITKLTAVPDTHLHYLDVNDGKQIRKVICGAANVSLHAKVVLAIPGAVLSKMTIKECEIRGMLSQGMCCSFAELGISNERRHHGEGIIILPSDAPLGDDAIKYLGIDDEVLEIKVTPNRGDCLSIVGLAREISAIFKRPFVFNESSVKLSNKKINNVLIQTSKCQYFSLRQVSGIKVAPSPQWLVNFLLNHGLRPINNIVDISNYILINYGQPLHIYDQHSIGSADFVISDNYSGSFTTLLNQQVELLKGDIIITAGKAQGCVGGIIGAQETAVNDNTKDILVEAAVFDATQIRLTSRRLDLASESSQRFIRGVNEEMLPYARDAAISLILELAGGTSDGALCEQGTLNPLMPSMQITTKEVNKLLGTTFDEAILIDTWQRLGLTYKVDGNVHDIQGCLRRKDLKIKEDLIEEIIRLQGFEKLPSTFPVTNPSLSKPRAQQLKEAIKKLLIYNGIYESINYSLSESDDEGLFVSGMPVKLLHPISSERQYFRKTLLLSLLKTARFNASRQNSDIAFFEMSYVASESCEKELLSILLSGNTGSRFSPRPGDAYYIKGILLSLLRLLGIDENRMKIINTTAPYFHQGRCAVVQIDNMKISYFGQLSRHLAPQYELKEAAMMELDLTALLNINPGKTRLEEISAFPSSTRDIAFTIGEEVSIASICETVKRSGGPLLKKVEVFDIYRHESLSGKSVAVSLTFSDLTKTLSDVEVNQAVSGILIALADKLGAKIRA